MAVTYNKKSNPKPLSIWCLFSTPPFHEERHNLIAWWRDYPSYAEVRVHLPKDVTALDMKPLETIGYFFYGITVYHLSKQIVGEHVVL